jgi:ribosomal protein S19
MKRSSWKLPYLHPILFKSRVKNKNFFVSFARNILLTKPLLQKKVKIYNGIWFLSRDANTNLLGHKTGEISFTKKCDTQLHLKRKSKKKSVKRKR